MPSVETRYEHIVLKDSVPVISGTRMKVVLLVEECLGSGWSPEEAHQQFPFLTMGQIHSALAYYWDHKEELDREIERRIQTYERLRAEQEQKPFPLRERLRARGLI
jgi:uncharacterized protein (DUF433 family)